MSPLEWCWINWILRLFSLFLGHCPSATWLGLYLTPWSSNPSPRQFLLLSLLAICAGGRDALGGWMLLSADGLSEGTRKKKETEMHIWHVSSHPSNWQVFWDEREEPTDSSMVHHSLGHGSFRQKTPWPWRSPLPKYQALLAWQRNIRDGSRTLQPPLWFLQGAQPSTPIKPTQLSLATQQTSAWF